jgi:hypothetical protein
MTTCFKDHVMKYIVIAYIKPEAVISIFEDVMSYMKFDTIESNISYRAFAGMYKEGIDMFVEKLNTHLEEVDFDVEDSIFFLYPRFSVNKRPDIGMLVIKRKGNKHLRKPY